MGSTKEPKSTIFQSLNTEGLTPKDTAFGDMDFRG